METKDFARVSFLAIISLLILIVLWALGIKENFAHCWPIAAHIRSYQVLLFIDGRLCLTL